MLLSEEGSVLKIIPTYAREVFDVSGAGDTVIAALKASLAATKRPIISCTTPGPTSIQTSPTHSRRSMAERQLPSQDVTESGHPGGQQLGR